MLFIHGEVNCLEFLNMKIINQMFRYMIHFSYKYFYHIFFISKFLTNEIMHSEFEHFYWYVCTQKMNNDDDYIFWQQSQTKHSILYMMKSTKINEVMICPILNDIICEMEHYIDFQWQCSKCRRVYRIYTYLHFIKTTKWLPNHKNNI